MTEKLSQAGCDTVRASVMRPVTDSHGSAGEIRRGGKEIACGRKDGCDAVQSAMGERGGSVGVRVLGAGKKGNRDGGVCGKKE